MEPQENEFMTNGTRIPPSVNIPFLRLGVRYKIHSIPMQGGCHLLLQVSAELRYR